MAPTGRVNGALFVAAPGPGCPGPTRTHPVRQRPGDGAGKDRQGERWKDRERQEVGRDRAVDGKRKTEEKREREVRKDREMNWRDLRDGKKCTNEEGRTEEGQGETEEGIEMEDAGWVGNRGPLCAAPCLATGGGRGPGPPKVGDAERWAASQMEGRRDPGRK